MFMLLIVSYHSIKNFDITVLFWKLDDPIFNQPMKKERKRVYVVSQRLNLTVFLFNFEIFHDGENSEKKESNKLRIVCFIKVDVASLNVLFKLLELEIACAFLSLLSA